MGDAELFKGMYQDSYPQVLAYVTSLVGRQAGEDITSETFAIAWRRYGEVRPMTLPWLLGVARNLIRELRRRDARQYELAIAEGLRVSTDAVRDDPADDVTERLAVLSALALLSAPDRELLTLLAWQALSVSEAAQVLGCSSATLSVRLHRARRRLERALDSQSEPRACGPDGPTDGATPRNAPGLREDLDPQVGRSNRQPGEVGKAPSASGRPQRLAPIMKGAEGA
jgi:RNA polymerase sigma-70 factor, ECF subfamily